MKRAPKLQAAGSLGSRQRKPKILAGGDHSRQDRQSDALMNCEGSLSRLLLWISLVSVSGLHHISTDVYARDR